MAKHKENNNQHGEQPSDKPSEALIRPTKKGKKFIGDNTIGDRNSTAKDPKLGNRNTTR